MKTRLVTVILIISLLGCSKHDPSLPDCAAVPLFSVLPVNENSIHSLTPIGGTNPPSHSIPSDHVGFYLNNTGIDLVAPADITIAVVRSVKYVESPFRKGESDYSIQFKTCSQLTGIFGHVKTLSTQLAGGLNFTKCDTYSTADETIESCSKDVSIQVKAGELLGTVGSSYQNSFDFGLYDARVTNFFINPTRFSSNLIHTVCPYDNFESSLKSKLYQKIGNGAILSTEEPICGTVVVDVANTAQGVWVLQGTPVTTQSDESVYATLRPDPYFMQTKATLVFGLAELNPASPVTFETMANGRVNRPFNSVLKNGNLHCYTSNLTTSLNSYLISLSANNTLTVEFITHGAGNSPCIQDPNSWSFSGTEVMYVR